MASKVGRPATKGTRAGNGRGWGGPAKGAATTRGAETRFATDSDSQSEHVRKRGDPLVIARAAERAAVTALLHGVMLDIATDPRQPGACRTNAAVALDNRINGMPVARTMAVGTDALDDLTDEQLAAIATGLGRDAA